MPRPTDLGSEISVKSIDDADLALAELSWLQNEQARLDAITKQKIDALKDEYDAKKVVTLYADDPEQTVTVSFADRVATLTGPLTKWVTKHIASHFKGKKKSVDRLHGTLGLRQQPRVVMVGKETSAAKVLDAIDEKTGIVTAANGLLTRKQSELGGQAKDWISIEVKLDLAAINAAIEEKRIERATVEELGLIIRDAYDDAVIKPAKTIVSAE
ncbi:host-nuclease inhibitor Gam family protein [Schlesneria paludicola]|uniref:host-nuclease inhibitor Gam family protein n=1 Tax=Schlesneria paludicola TaxID=360056 RepID=UPI00029A0159|nr:host-nuclease inhibitor Gam family protein [Schlesneria paludicola]